ncbi:MAG: HD domain-containing protein [Chitinophagales bacterium]
MNKKKIINDPVYGFLNIPHKMVFNLIEHPHFQRLRRIQQLGLTSLVYPGALHTRFHHALGATHLMKQAIEVLRAKKVKINQEEGKAAITAILMHDIGHGPFSHALEHSIVTNVPHEMLSLLFMQRLNKEFGGRLDLAIQIFKGEYHKSFLHELVSSQLDMDRLDYLNRDSFFTGVQEGVIGFDRIIKMLAVRDNHLVVEEKGIYSIEKFLIARRLMYWQVYLHKTVIAAELMLLKILQRAKQLIQEGHNLSATPPLLYFLQSDFTLQNFEENPEILEQFALLDDTDILVGIKVWQFYKKDVVLSELCKGVLSRKLLKIELGKEPISPNKLKKYQEITAKKYKISLEDAAYLVFADKTSNSAYTHKGSQINILYKNETIKNITEASDYLNIEMLASPVVKHYICYPEIVRKELKR